MSADPSLPSGLVTFVFTDIEGSTKLFRQLGEAYPPLLEEHNALLREVWSAHGGVEVKTAGDSFLVAFASAADALTAAAAAQQAVTSHAWATGATVRVRIGVHAGIAFPRNGDYIALALHQAARVVGAASGGYVLASEEALAAAADDLSVTTRLVGTFRLRDFEKPAQLFAIAAPGASVHGEVPVRAIPAAGHNLVAPATTFVGRQDAVADLSSRLAANQLVSIVGPGGMGKTRLATQVGLEVASEWPDGVWMADLTTVSDGDGVVSVVADALGVVGSDRPAHDAVLEYLESRSTVVILDNCEHLLDTVARFASAVLTRCPSVALLATTREPLAIAGEDVWRIDPLPITAESAGLFVDRARSVAATYDTSRDEDVIIEICRQLDGMPLAIELAAARVGVLSPREILDGLNKRFSLLRSRDRTVSDRQRTMQGLLDWSYQLLDVQERLALARLSVFSGSFDLDGARASVGHGEIDPEDVPDLVWALSDKSLVNVERTSGETRYRLLETVRAYGAIKLDDALEAVPTSRALAAYYFDRFPLTDIGRREFMSALTNEVDTIGSLAESLSEANRADDAYALARIRAEQRITAGRLALAAEEISRILDLNTDLTACRLRLQLQQVNLDAAMGKVDSAHERLRDVMRLLATCGDTDRWGRLAPRRALANLALRTGSPDELREAEELLRADLSMQSASLERLDNLSTLAWLLLAADPVEGRRLDQEVIALAREVGDHSALASTLSQSAEAAIRAGDDVSAVLAQREAMLLAAELGMPIITSFSLIIAARITEPADAETAVLLHASAQRMLDEIELVLGPDDRAFSDEMLVRARDRLGDSRFAALDDEGRAMPLDRAIELTQQVFNQVAPPD